MPELLKILLSKRIFQNAVEVSDTAPTGKISALKIVLEEMVKITLVGPADDCFKIPEFDKTSSMVDPEGCEDIKEACWVRIRKILEANWRDQQLVEAVANSVLRWDPQHKLPEFITKWISPVGLTHLYLNYGRIEDAGMVLISTLNRGEYMDPVLYAKVCEALKGIAKMGGEGLTARQLLAKLGSAAHPA